MSVEHVMFLSALIVGTLGFAHLALNVSRTGVPESGTRTCTGVA